MDCWTKATIPTTAAFSVSLDALDPCDPANGFAGGNLETNNAPLQPYSLINIEVTDQSGNPLHLAQGAIANVFAPIANSCMDPTVPTPTTASLFAQTNPSNIESSPISTAVHVVPLRKTSCQIMNGVQLVPAT